MSGGDWQPSASPALWQARAALNRQIRRFFGARGVLEVETPLLAQGIGTDANLHPISAQYQPHPHAANTTLYLQTSPEFAMKRLLAAGSGAIFQLCKAFRNGEYGRRHNPEFTMLEWYRPGFTLSQLMDEVEALVVHVLGCAPCKRVTYRELFQQHLGLDPHTAELATLVQCAREQAGAAFDEAPRDTWLDLLYSQVIEPRLRVPVFIHDYPASQAALARIAPDITGVPVAQRFELVIAGMEIANGYDELTDAAEQQRRFDRDLLLRRELGLPALPADMRLLAALHSGLPACTGVALGVDRLLMLQTGADSIDAVLTFPHPCA
jgi:lysyl-tRNA synthetase class 2